MKVFIAGPMQGIKDWNALAFDEASLHLREYYEVVNPAMTGMPDGWKWNDYLASSLGQLVTCDAIALLPGWERSKGACLEHEVAQRIGLFIIPLDNEGKIAWPSKRQRSGWLHRCLSRMLRTLDR